MYIWISFATVRVNTIVTFVIANIFAWKGKSRQIFKLKRGNIASSSKSHLGPEYEVIVPEVTNPEHTKGVFYHDIENELGLVVVVYGSMGKVIGWWWWWWWLQWWWWWWWDIAAWERGQTWSPDKVFCSACWSPRGCWDDQWSYIWWSYI